jgi:hypothetical protein
MTIYDINLYNVTTDTATIVISLPERRQDPERPRGKIAIERWARSLLGEDWWLKNWHNISIAVRHSNHLQTDIEKARFFSYPGR